MNYLPIGEVSQLQLSERYNPGQIVMDAQYMGQLATRRGLGAFYLTDADEWSGVSDALADPGYWEAGRVEHERRGVRWSSLRPLEDGPTEEEEMAEEMSRLSRGLDPHRHSRPLAEVRVGYPRFRHSHDRPDFAIGVDTVELDRQFANQIDDTQVAVPPAQVAAALLNKAMKQGLREAVLEQNLNRMPAGERNTLFSYLVPTLVTSAVVGAELGFGAMAASYSLGAVAQNAVRAYLATREGAPLRDFCWSVLPEFHIDRVIGRIPPRRPIVKALQ